MTDNHAADNASRLAEEAVSPVAALSSSSFTPSWTSSLTIPAPLAATLRPHQTDALHFMWRKLVDEGLLYMAARSTNCTVNQRLDLYQQVYGCILGHSMGLGKTLTTVSFVLLLQAQLWLMTLKRNHALRANAGAAPPNLCRALRVLVLCPLSCVSHWQQSIDEWVRPELFGRVSLPVYAPSVASGSVSSSVPRYNATVESFYTQGGILLMGYEEFTHYARHAAAQSSASSSSSSRRFDRVGSALDAIRARVPMPSSVTYLDRLESADVVILDEAHRLRKQTTQLVQALTEHLRHTQLRVAVTGTPIQNHLESYNVMQSVVTGRVLDTKKFHKYFVAPIERGQCSDATAANFSEMQKCVASLRLFFADTVHHCGPELLEAALPPRHEHVFFFTLSAAQDKLYRAMQKHFIARMSEQGSAAVMLNLYHQSSHLCLHPCLVTADLDAPAHNADRGPPADGTDPRAAPSGDALSLSEEEDSIGDEVGDAWGSSLAVDAVDVSLSPKLVFTLALVRHIIEDRREKVVIYSRYISHVNLITALVRRDMHVEALVLTGATSNADRRAAIGAFNDGTAHPVMVASVGAGGVGIKLTAANHCLLLDVGWNPADDAQVTFRIFRFGQTRPVYVYRMATYGTCEHVVFAYALQKSWLHRKIADAADPTRHAQHVKANYLVYPCRIPLEGDGEDMNEASVAVPLSPAVRAQMVLARCEASCEPAAAVLRQLPDLQASVRTVIPHSFLLRDTTDEMVSAMSARFAAVAQNSLAQKSTVVVAPVLPATPVARPPQSLLQQCEPDVADVAHEAANFCILHVIQQAEAERVRLPENAAQGDERDSAAVVRTTDAALRRALAPLLPDVLPGAVQAPLRHTAFLAETVLAFYALGVHAVTQRLHTTRYAKLRTALTSRIPFDGHRRHHDTSAHGILAETLSTRPSRVFGGLRPTEETYVCTELGFTRTFVKQCIVMGFLDRCLSQYRAGALSEADVEALTRLFASDAPPSQDEGVMADDEAALGGVLTMLPDLPLHSPAVRLLCGTLSSFFDGLWPAFAGFSPPPLSMALHQEQALTARALQAARRSPWSGFLSLKEVCSALQLAPYQGRADQLACRRCRGAVLRRRSATELVCPLCHYNAEFEAVNHTGWYHQIFLYRLSVLTNALEALSLTRAFTETVEDDTNHGEDDDGGNHRVDDGPARGTVVLLERLRAPCPHSLAFTDKCLAEGVDATLRALPPSLAKLLSLQCGAGLDLNVLQDILLANAHLAWSASVRTHVKAAVVAALHTASHLGPTETMPGGSSMPAMMLVVALLRAARSEGVHHAHELLRDSTARSPRHTLLRFVCDAVVRLRFLARLQTVHATERAEDKARRRDAEIAPASASVSTPTLSFLSDSDSAADSEPGPTAPPPLPAPARRLAPAWTDSDDDEESRGHGHSTELPMPARGLRGNPRGGPGQKRTRASTGTGRDSRHRRYDVPFTSRSRSASSSSSSDSLSSFAPCASAELSSAGSSASEERATAWGPGRGHDTAAKCRIARVNAYWLAHCQVYGTESAEQMPVYVDEGASGLTLLPAPPSGFWSLHMTRLPGQGMELSAVISAFFEHILPLVRAVRVIE